ncbi:MAG: NAD(P)/FAD-dependent oxidoreductase, partial [Actinomycetota bacterium]
LGLDAPVLPIRCQIAHLDLPDLPDTGAWPMVQPVHGHYMVPWPGGRVVVGATVEDAGFAPTTTVAGVEEVMREAQRVLPGLAGAALRELRVGLRPWSTDGLPLLGVVADAPVTSTVVVAAGHGANGLMLGPLSGRIAADLALGRTPAADPAPFAPGRFSARA